MPFQPINFAGIQPQQGPDLISALMQGYQMGQMPAQMRRQAEQEQLANQLTQMKLQTEPENMALKNALLKAKSEALQNKMNLPFGGEIAPGSIGQAMWLDMIGKKYGTDSPEYSNAKRSYESDLAKSQGLLDYRNALVGNMGKRFSTSLGKEEQEISDIQSGFMPGTGRTQQLSPQEQQEMLGRYELKRQKDISDNQSRNKALFASNIDKTLDMIDPKDLTQYSGLQGLANFKKDQLSSAFGKPSESFLKYNKALTAANTLSKQVRQFYGDSITPQIQEKLSMLTNPTSWQNDPKVSIENFNTFKNLLNKETGTYRGALKSTEEYEGKKSTPDQKTPIGTTTGTTEIRDKRGILHKVPNNLLEQFKKEML